MVVAAVVVLASVPLASAWVLRQSPDPLSEIASMWRLPWGKQIFLDFYGLEVVLLLWMLSHASDTGSWLNSRVARRELRSSMPEVGSPSASGSTPW